MLMTLGLFVFNLDTLPYQQLQRSTAWRHADGSRIGPRPLNQYLGPGDDKITLSGWLAPEIAGDPLSLDELRIMADTGQPYPLISSQGAVYGLSVIEEITEGQQYFLPDGTARRVEFSIKIKRVDDDMIDQVSLITDTSGVLV